MVHAWKFSLGGLVCFIPFINFKRASRLNNFRLKMSDPLMDDAVAGKFGIRYLLVLPDSILACQVLGLGNAK